MHKSRAIFLDRDGVINELVKRPDGRLTSPWLPSELRFKPRVKEAIELAKDAGYLVFIVTNQPGISDGDMSPENLNLIHTMMIRWLEVDHILSAEEKDSPMYKPNNGMIEQLLHEFNVARTKSYMIGDRWKDVVAGRRSRLFTIWVRDHAPYDCPKEYSQVNPNYTCNNVYDAVHLILELNRAF